MVIQVDVVPGVCQCLVINAAPDYVSSHFEACWPIIFARQSIFIRTSSRHCLSSLSAARRPLRAISGPAQVNSILRLRVHEWHTTICQQVSYGMVCSSDTSRVANRTGEKVASIEAPKETEGKDWMPYLQVSYQVSRRSRHGG